MPVFFLKAFSHTILPIPLSTQFLHPFMASFERWLPSPAPRILLRTVSSLWRVAEFYAGSDRGGGVLLWTHAKPRELDSGDH